MGLLNMLMTTMMMTTSANSQNFNDLESPCPGTFEYQMDQNGNLYGAIGIYSFDENIVELNVEMSVGNRVQEDYNGEIVLAYPKNRIIDDIIHRRPVRYKLFFPRWERIPPKITKIMVNRQIVCRGPHLRIGGLITFLTTISLQHTLTLKVSTLQSSGPLPPSNSNPFLSNSNNYGNFNLQDNPYFTSFNNRVGSTTEKSPITTTTENISPAINSITSNNDDIFSKNPFFNGAITNIQPSVVQTTTVANVKPDYINNRVNRGGICGLPVVPNPLIINGNHVIKGAFPWLAAIFGVINTGLEYKCGGTLISNKHIVTAAHCVQNDRKRIEPHKFLFVLGKNNIQRWTPQEGEKMVEAQEIYVHPDYVPMTSDADIAVVLLTEQLQFTKYIRPICLWEESSDLELVVGEVGKVVGWGKDENGNIMTAEPKQTTIPIVSQEQCLRSSDTFTYITSNRTFCAGNRNGTGPCNGDSGSGFVMKRNGRWYLKGVVSISTYDSNKQSCDLSNYVVFTDASKFLYWLLTFIQ